MPRNRVAQQPPPGSAVEFSHPFFLPRYWVFHGSGGCRTAIQVCRTTFHVCCYGSPHHSFGVHLSTWLTVRKERARMSRRNTPEKFFSAVRGCPRSCARTNPWFCGPILGEKRAQEPPAGSAVKHCRFLGTGGGGGYTDTDTHTGQSTVIHSVSPPIAVAYNSCLFENIIGTSRC